MAAYSSDPTTMASPLTAGPVGFAPSKYSHSRTQSVSSDRPSTIAHSLMSAPLAVSPEAAFVAASAASQIVTNDHDAHSETWYDQVGIEPSGETALVSTGALQLANSFIDHILFNIIATAKSTRLSSLRPAVGEVLKPKLAQDAVNNADEELREYLGGGDIEDLESAIPAAAGRDWDLELAWKRTRLRCMVYSSLGDMEEEDEDYYMEQEHLRGNGDDILSETVSPAVAIFLTSILEFMGEQVLVVSGQAAFNRLRLKYEKELKDGSRSPGEIADRIVVDELDMERVALDRTFGRLWRAWKKKMRSPTEQNFSRPFSRNSFGASQNRRDSGATDNFASPIVSNGDIDPVSNLVVERTPENNKAAEPVPEPTEIALPLSPRDIDEIEIPGLVFYSDDELSDEDEYDFVQAPRPNSMVIWPPRPTWKEADDGVVGDVELAQADEEDEETKLSEPEMNRDGLATGIAPPMHPLTSGEPDTIKAGGNEAQYTGVTSHGDTTSNPEVVSEVAADLAVAPHVNRVHHRSRPRARSQPGSSRRRRYSPVTKEISDAGDFEKPTLANEQEPIASEHSAATEISPEAVEGAEHASAVKVIGSAITASAVGGAVAAIALTNTGRAPSTRSGKDIADELDEEPQIMTSSRVSVYGAPEGAIPSPGLPRRTSSIRSARIIDVPSRSPTTLSRTSSIDAMERSTSRGPPVNAAAAALRSPRMPTPPIAEEPSSSHTRGVLAPIDPRDVTQLGAPPKRTRPSNSSAPQQAASYPAPIKTSMTSPLVVEEDERSGPASYMRRSPLPTLPERNASRPNHQAQPNKVSPESPKPPRHVVAEPPVPASSKLRTTVRGSEENTASSAAPAPAPRAQNMARDFEELMNSDQTLQYTLTPENMRDISASSTENSIGVGSKGRRSEDAKFVERSRSSSVQRSASVSKTNGLNSHPVPESSSAGKLNGPVPRAGQYSPTKARVTASSQQARDARVPRESMQDFAAFIRSTGPPADQAPLKRVGTGGSTTGFRQSSSPVTSSKDMNHGRTESASRIRQTARDPTVTESDSADLADFLRRGPPPANGSGARVQRQAIPPRSAPDYDYHPSAPIRNSEASTTFTEASVPSSLNSSSALLGRNKPTQPSNNFDDGEMMPQRKQRRVRDPYAIDFSDEDDDEELFADVPQPKTKPKQEESLIDFLKNYEPPPEPVSAPVMTPPTLPKKRSASNLMARLRSNGHSSSGSISGKQSSKPSVEPRPPNTAPSGTSRGYTPITVNIPPDSDKLGSFFEAPAPRPPQSSGRVPMKKFEPRDAASSSTRTNDLAAFLRDSEPPPSAPPVQRPGRSESQQSSSGFSRVFDRRKKTSGF